MITSNMKLDLTPEQLEELEKRYTLSDLDKTILQGLTEGKNFIFLKGRRTGDGVQRKILEELFAEELKEGKAIIISEDTPVMNGMKAFEEGFNLGMSGRNRRSKRKQQTRTT